MKLVLLLLALSILLAFPATAQEAEVGLYILNLGKFDVATGSFTADFYLSMNGRAVSVDRIIDEPDERFYRILANLNSPVDLRRFPFDRQQMQVIIEDKRQQADVITYAPAIQESGIDKSIAFTGWRIDGWRAEQREHAYPLYNETYSQYVFSVDISRIPFNSFLKTFLPVLFIVLIVMFTYIMDPDKISSRLTVASSSLIAAVMFHISIANQIPPTGYLTTADKFMILTYLFLLATIILNVLLLELHELKRMELAEKIHRRTEYAVFVAVPIIYLLFFIIVL